jgi:hypothetical protein
VTSTKIQNTLLLPGGTPAPERHNTKVRILLVNGGFDTDSSFVGGQQIPEIIGLYYVKVKPNGQWEAILPPNSQVQPPGTYYRVEERVGRVPVVHTLIVPEPIPVSAIAREANEVGAAVPAGHKIERDDVITVDVTDGSFGGMFTVTFTTTTSINWDQVGADDPDGGTGFITKDWDIKDLVIP